MTEILQLDPVYLRAAANGDTQAQAGLAQLLLSAGSDSIRTDLAIASELLATAEAYARLAAESGAPSHYALLAAVQSVRCVQLRDSDPVRSVQFREAADVLFDHVEASGDVGAITYIGGALTELAAAGDEEAGDRLERIVASLPAFAAVLLREWEREMGTIEECKPSSPAEANTGK